MTVEAWYGEKPGYENERSFARRLAERLNESHEKHLILCNVYIPGAGRADFLVLTEWRIFVLELKHCDSPLLAPLNGPWQRLAADGGRRPLESGNVDLNVYEQVGRYVYALRDWLRRDGKDVLDAEKRKEVERYWPQGGVVVEPHRHPGSQV